MGTYIVAFESTHAAMAADDALAATPHALIPTPRGITADCGMALRFAAEDDGRAQVAIEAARIQASLFTLYCEEADEEAPALRAYRRV